MINRSCFIGSGKEVPKNQRSQTPSLYAGDPSEHYVPAAVNASTMERWKRLILV